MSKAWMSRMRPESLGVRVVFSATLAIALFLSACPSEQNQPVMPDWERADLAPRSLTGGFDASAFRSSSGQVVIAFRGTDFSFEGGTPDFWYGNIPAGTGASSEQISRAIEFVADAIQRYGKANIVLTGHSLGGGLAGVVAAFFDLPATVFAPAPFANSATDVVVSLLNPGTDPLVERSGMVNTYFLRYVGYQIDQGRAQDIDQAFEDYAELFADSDLQPGMPEYYSRIAQVNGISLQGQILEPLYGNPYLPTPVGTLTPIEAARRPWACLSCTVSCCTPRSSRRKTFGSHRFGRRPWPH